MQFKPQSISSDSVLSLSDDLNSIINKGESFLLKKHDFSTTVGILKGDNFGLPRDLLVKRFNYRGFFDFLLHKLFECRGKRLWVRNLRLYKKGLPVPEPIAYVKPSFRQKNAFFLSSVIEDADSLGSAYTKGIFRKDRDLLRELARTISEWHLKGAVHGDLKWPNILVQKNQRGYKFFLIDLDQSRLYSTPSMKGIIKDLKRFYRFGLETGAEDWVEFEFFPAYVSLIPAEMKAGISFDRIKQGAMKDWIKKGRKRIS
ncbi:MAG: lipopolysaccharide kinase InaA family protein [Nitrospirota bacterium]